MSGQESAFDRWVYHFATVDLGRRARSIALISFILIVVTCVTAGYLLFQDFKIIIEGQQVLGLDRLVDVKVPQKYEGLLSNSVEMILQDKEQHEILIHSRLRGLEKKGEDLILKLELPDLYTEKYGPELRYKLVLEKRSYWSMLLEKDI